MSFRLSNNRGGQSRSKFSQALAKTHSVPLVFAEAIDRSKSIDTIPQGLSENQSL